MKEILSAVINELLRYSSSNEISTELFKKKKHNRDLCPNIADQIENVLDCFNKYRQIAYDIQGIRDYGTDIVLRHGKEGVWKYICFQIKSYDDLKAEDYLSKQKAQYFDSKAFYRDNLEHYFLLLCTYVGEHREKIRQIRNEFKTVTDVTIIDPGYVIDFLQLNQTHIYAMAEYMLKEDDVVMKEATKLLLPYSPTEVALLLTVIMGTLNSFPDPMSPDEVHGNLFLSEIYSQIPDYDRDHWFYRPNPKWKTKTEIKTTLKKLSIDRQRALEERLADDLESIGEITLDTETGNVHVDIKAVLPLVAIVTDIHARYGYNLNECLEHVFMLLRNDRGMD